MNNINCTFTISTTKNFVYKFINELHFRFCTEDSDIYVQSHRASSKLRNSLPITSNTHTIPPASEPLRPSSSSDMHNFPTAVVMTQGRKVKTSLQRLQQQQDEIFQL